MGLIAALQSIITAERLPPRRLPARRTDPGALGAGFIDPRQRPGTRRIAITFDQAPFDRVRDYAAARRISFAAAARELIDNALAAQTGEKE